MTIGRFRVKAKAMQRCEYEAFKHADEIWQIEDEAVLIPFDMYLQIQSALAELETRG